MSSIACSSLSCAADSLAPTRSIRSPRLKGHIEGKGYSVMAVFRAPVAQEDHAERALHTALALVRRTAELFGETISPVFVGRDSETELLGAAYRRVARD